MSMPADCRAFFGISQVTKGSGFDTGMSTVVESFMGQADADPTFLSAIH
jgi:hypothetical protein